MKPISQTARISKKPKKQTSLKITQQKPQKGLRQKRKKSLNEKTTTVPTQKSSLSPRITKRPLFINVGVIVKIYVAVKNIWKELRRLRELYY
jgi:hypothetical protein